MAVLGRRREGVRSDGMGKNGGAVTVSFPGKDNGCKAGVGHMDAQSCRKGSSMQSIKEITFEIVRQFSSLTDTGNKTTLVGTLSQFGQRRPDGGQDAEIRASGAPLGGDLVFEVIHFYHGNAS